MPEFRLPHPNIDSSSTQDAIEKLRQNLMDLVQDYNRVLRDLDAEVFYHIVPIKTGEAVTISATTLTHRVVVVIDDDEYYLPLRPV